MSVIGNPLLLTPEGYQISRSVRLRRSASAYFNRTPASAGNQTLWTWSGWLKRGQFGVLQSLIHRANSSAPHGGIRFDASDKLTVGADRGGSNYWYFSTAAVFRDPSAWYHIVVVLDTAQATQANRCKIYVNGELQATTINSGNSTPSLNDTMGGFNSNVQHHIGVGPLTTDWPLDGYLTEINFIDGQALTPSSFGETDAVTGVWKPKKYAGTYGTNGFYLNFSDPSAATAAAIGKDYSGNGNNWTPNNISVTAGVTYDSMIDVPTPYADGGTGRGNYCTLNPLNRQTGSSAAVLANGNLSLTVPSGVNASPGAYAVATATHALTTGKWYFEAVGQQVSGGAGVHTVGVTNALTFNFNGTNYYTASFSNVRKDASASSAVVMIAYDADNGLFWKGENGTWDAGNPSAGTGGTSYAGPVLPFAQGYNDTTNRVDAHINFGQRPFAYTPPTGFKALNTQNLPEPTIKKGNQYFDATTWTGDGSSNRAIVNAASMAPDWVWIKSRSGTYGHRIFDSVRGANKRLVSNSTDAEASPADELNSFNADGFTVGADTDVNANAATYVGWQWKAGGTPAVTNTAGSITSTVSANPTAGFSIVTWTTPSTGIAYTIGHGLGVAPSLIIMKERTTGSTSWVTHHKAVMSNSSQYLLLNTTGAITSASNIFGSSMPSSTVFGNTSGTGINVSAQAVAYLFAEVPGFSKFGSYTGNASVDGPFVFLGFRPRWLLIKRSDSSGDWFEVDTARNTVNPLGSYLIANSSAAEVTSSLAIDATANGFKIRVDGTSWPAVNPGGGTVIYAAFAEHPFKNALAR